MKKKKDRRRIRRGGLCSAGVRFGFGSSGFGVPDDGGLGTIRVWSKHKILTLWKE